MARSHPAPALDPFLILSVAPGGSTLVFGLGRTSRIRSVPYQRAGGGPEADPRIKDYASSPVSDDDDSVHS